MRRSVLLLLLLAGSLTLFSQEKNPGSETVKNCTEKLERADFLYQSGLFNDCIRILEEAINTCIFSRSEKEKAFGLLAKSYLETDEPESADAAMHKMLSNSPHYELKEGGNFESYNRLVKKYEIHPRLSIGVRNVANWLSYKTTGVYSLLDGLDYGKPVPRSDYWFMYYAIAEYEFDRSFSLNLEGGFFWSSYSRIIEKDPGFILDFWEREQFVETILYVKKYFPYRRNILPYVSAGIGSLWLYKAYANVSVSYTADDVVTGKNTDYSASLSRLSTMDLRNTNIWCWNAGFGIGYKLKNLRLFLDTRYLGGLTNLTDNSKRYKNTTLTEEYFYIDNSMTINQFEVGASIYYTLFNSVKRIRR